MFKLVSRTFAPAAICLALAIPVFAQGPISRPNAAPNFISWSGSVDQAATVYIHGSHIWVNNVQGKPVTHIVSNFSPSLPIRHPVMVHLDRVQGRGTVMVIQQPTAANNFTAAVRIRDPQAGRAHYHFRLIWGDDDNGGDNHSQ